MTLPTITLLDSTLEITLTQEEEEEMNEDIAWREANRTPKMRRDELRVKCRGWIYFLSAPEGLFKIGKSTRPPSQRIAEYSPLLPFETHLAFILPTADVELSERFFHAVFGLWRVRGEWFRISENDIMKVAPGCDMYGAWQ